MFGNLKYKNINIFIVVFYSVFALLFAYYFQYFRGYPPCELCIYQRIPYFVAIFVGIFYLVIPVKDVILLRMLFLIFLSSFFISGFHFGVENDLWEYKSACSSGTNDFENIDDLRNFLDNAPIVKCNEVILSFWGVSMAALNMILSFIVSLFVLYSVKNVRFK